MNIQEERKRNKENKEKKRKEEREEKEKIVFNKIKKELEKNLKEIKENYIEAEDNCKIEIYFKNETENTIKTFQNILNLSVNKNKMMKNLTNDLIESIPDIKLKTSLTNLEIYKDQIKINLFIEFYD